MHTFWSLGQCNNSQNQTEYMHHGWYRWSDDLRQWFVIVLSCMTPYHKAVEYMLLCDRHVCVYVHIIGDDCILNARLEYHIPVKVPTVYLAVSVLISVYYKAETILSSVQLCLSWVGCLHKYAYCM